MNDIALAEHLLVLLAHFIQQTETVSMGHICRRKPLPLIQIEDQDYIYLRIFDRF